MLIVEDERWEREGLAELFDWPALGIGSVETACDGIEGLEKAIGIEPDIIVTDISMPGLSGIEMAKLIREKLPDVRFVVLTGYDDFQYARDAIRFGAVDYLLKPIDEEELHATLARIATDCVEAARRRGDEEQWRRAHEEGRRASLRTSLAALVADRELAAEDAAGLVAALAVAFEGPAPEAFGIWIVRAPAAVDRTAPAFFEEEAAQALQRPVIAYTTGEGAALDAALLFGIRTEEAESLPELATRLLHRLASVQSPMPGGEWTVAIGGPAKTLPSARETYREAVKALRFAVWSGRTGVAEAADEVKERASFAREAETLDRRFKELAKQVRSSLGSGDEQAAEETLDQLFALIAAYPGASRAYVVSLLGGLVEGMLSVAAPAGLAAEGDNAFELEALLASEGQGELRIRMQTAVRRMARMMRDKRGNKDDSMVERVVRLIEERYGNPSLGLAYLAGEVFVSPNHLGATFKKKTGKTPTEYIQDYRLARAEELLRTTGLRVSAVAERVGIPNTSYFGTLFKNAYGMTPGEYQDMSRR
ncbi:response regulator [Cohnella sp. GCM10012308]|uniref:response regulator n=1 Tax=Cohnella sp. GCM10012308 TaxID=3317329 RepID=UPI0036085FCF